MRMGASIQLKRDGGLMRKRSKKNYGALRGVRVSTRDLAETAAEKILELAYDIGGEIDHQYGWKAYAARRIGIDARILVALQKGSYGPHNGVGLALIQRVARKIGLSVSELLGEG
jgi:hypothetical protein